MNIRDVLYMRNTGKLRPRASIQDKLLGKKLYDRNSGVITTTTGNPVSIITSKAQDAISTILSYSAKQSGSGDPSPINIRPFSGVSEVNLSRCGKNILDIQSTTIKKWSRYNDTFYTIIDSNPGITFNVNTDDSVNVRTNTNNYGIGFSIDPSPVERTFSYKGNPNPNSIALYSEYADGATRISSSASNTLTVPANTSGFIGLYFMSSGVVAKYNLQVQVRTAGDTTDYEQYITPTTYNIKFPATGKNLFDKASIDFPTGTTIKYFPIKLPDGQYTLSTDFPEHEDKDVFFLSGKVSSGASSSYNGVCVGSPRTTQTVNGYVTVAFRYNSYRENPSDYNYQLELGSSATPYEPYTTTAYGGTVDLERGVLIVTHVIETFDETDGWEIVNNRFRANKIPQSALAKVSSNTYYCISSNWIKYQPVSGSSSLSNNSGVWFVTTNNFFIRAGEIATIEAFNTFIAENPLQVVCTLATPLEIPLTPQTVALLNGANTIWTDVDEVSVTYKAKK